MKRDADDEQISLDGVFPLHSMRCMSPARPFPRSVPDL